MENRRGRRNRTSQKKEKRLPGDAEQKAKGERLLESERRFRAVADFTYSWETWFGTEANPLWINPAVERMTGYTVTECMAMPAYPLPLVAPDDRELIAGVIAGATGLSEGNNVEFRIVTRQGDIRWAAMSWQPFFDDAQKASGVEIKRLRHRR